MDTPLSLVDIGLMVVGGIVLLILLSSMVFKTDQQTVRLVHTFGKYSYHKGAGLGFKLPWPIQSVTPGFSLRIREIKTDVEIKSSNNAFVSLPIRVQFKVDEKRVREAYYVLDDPIGQIKTFIAKQVLNTASGMTFDELFTSKDQFQKDVHDTLTSEMTEFGYIIRNVQVNDPQPSEDMKKAFDRVLTSERLKEAAKNEGEAARILLVADAEAHKEALKLRGEALSTFRTTIAEGNADAVNLFVKGTNLSPQSALDFMKEVNEMEAMVRAAEAGGRTVFITGSGKDLGATAVMATIGEAEAAQEAVTRREAQQRAAEERARLDEEEDRARADTSAASLAETSASDS